MKLSEILNKLDIKYKTDKTIDDPEIKKLSMNSGEKNKNGVFFCIKGLNFDSHQFIEQAVENGALAIIHDKNIDEYKKKYKEIIFIEVENSRLALAKFAEILNDYPSKKLKVFGVTGTNGKTSVSYLIYKLLSNFEKSAYNGTAGTIIGNEVFPYTHLTTPNTLDLVDLFKNANSKDVKSMSMEVSSHALDMKRTAGIDFDIAIFTNFTRDHLDYHGTMSSYKKAKAELFKILKKDSVALINLDDGEADFFIKSVENSRIITYGKSKSSDYRFTNIKLSPKGTEFDLIYGEKTYKIKTNLVSEINVYNLTAAIAGIHESGKDLNKIIKFAEDIDFNIGRFQYIKSDKYSIIVDYAHTPDGLKKVFEFTDMFRKKGVKVISVLGSAGKRDKGKRPIMGEIVSKHSDLVILTEEDYRDESPLDIAKDIAKGFIENTEYFIQEDRELAIKLALEKAEENDVVLILGKGVEDFLDRGKKSYKWAGDDVIALKYADI